MGNFVKDSYSGRKVPMSEHESLHHSDQTPLALAECSFLTEGKKTSSKLNLSGNVFGAMESWCLQGSYLTLEQVSAGEPLPRGVLGKADTPGSNLEGGFASYLWSREPNVSFGVSESPVVELEC